MLEDLQDSVADVEAPGEYSLGEAYNSRDDSCGLGGVYFNRVSDLRDEFPEAWHLVMQAEDRCRGEQFERFHRKLTRARTEGRLPMNLDFDPFRPWIGVMQFAARCQECWDRTVVRPTQTFLARGGASSATGRSMTQKEAEDSQFSDAAAAAMHRPSGEGLSKTAKRRQRDKAKIEKLQEDNRRQRFGNPPWLRNTGKGSAASSGDGDGHP